MRKLWSTLVAVLFSGGIAAAAFIPLWTPTTNPGQACIESSQSLYCYNQIFGIVNSYLGLVAAQPGPVASAATSAEQVLATTTIPGGTLNTPGQELHLRCAGTSSATTDARLVRLYFGSAAISTGVFQGSAVNWELELIVQYGATAGSIPYIGRGSYGPAVTVSPISFNDVSDNLANGIVAKCTGTQSMPTAGELTEEVFSIDQVK